MNAVAIMTPVPKCLTEKNTNVGILSLLTRFATMGKRVPDVTRDHVRSYRMWMLGGWRTEQRYVDPVQNPLLHRLCRLDYRYFHIRGGTGGGSFDCCVWSFPGGRQTE
jgi:hypothetical protein